MSRSIVRRRLTAAAAVVGGLMSLAGVFLIGGAATAMAATGASLSTDLDPADVLTVVLAGSVMLFLGASIAATPRLGAPGILVAFASWGLVLGAALLGASAGFRSGAASAAAQGGSSVEAAREAAGFAAGLLAAAVVALAAAGGAAVGFFAWYGRQRAAAAPPPSSTPGHSLASPEESATTGVRTLRPR